MSRKERDDIKLKILEQYQEDRSSLGSVPRICDLIGLKSENRKIVQRVRNIIVKQRNYVKKRILAPKMRIEIGSKDKDYEKCYQETLKIANEDKRLFLYFDKDLGYYTIPESLIDFIAINIYTLEKISRGLLNITRTLGECDAMIPYTGKKIKELFYKSVIMLDDYLDRDFIKFLETDYKK